MIFFTKIRENYEIHFGRNELCGDKMDIRVNDEIL
jgi:hypothetical protein